MIIMGKTGKKSLAMIHKGVAKITEDKMLTNQPIKYVPLNYKYVIMSRDRQKLSLLSLIYKHWCSANYKPNIMPVATALHEL